MPTRLPKCGLYRTADDVILSPPQAGAGSKPVSIAKESLVSFHNHSKQGKPIILLPEKNNHNQWKFKDAGYLVDESAALAALQPLRPEGIYRLRAHFHPSADEVVAENALVQLGYTPKGEPIIFFPQRVEGTNAFSFPPRGLLVPQSLYDQLEPLDMRGPYKSKTHVH